MICCFCDWRHALVVTITKAEMAQTHVLFAATAMGYTNSVSLD